MRTWAHSSTISSIVESDNSPPERLILVYGNCQAHWLAGLLAAQGLGQVCIVGTPFGFYPEFHGLRPFFIDPAEAATWATRAKMLGRQVTILEQSSPLHPGLDEATLKLGSHVVRFPHLEVRAYWHPWLAKAADGFDPARIQRQFAFDLGAMRRSAHKAGWDGSLIDFLEETHQSSLHFYTLNHPGAALMQRLHAGVCAGLETRGALDRTAYEWAQDEIKAQGGIAFIAEHPLHDAVIDALGLTWAREGWYALWQQAYFLAGAGEHTRALEMLDEAAVMPDHDPHLYLTMGTLLSVRGQDEAALRAFGRAHRAYPQNPEYGRLWLDAHAGGDGDLAVRLQSELRSRLPPS